MFALRVLTVVAIDLFFMVTSVRAQVLAWNHGAAGGRAASPSTKLLARAGCAVLGRTASAQTVATVGGGFSPGPTTVTEAPSVPALQHHVAPPAPNPFNPRTTVAYVVGESGARVRIRLFDLRGRQVTSLVDGHQESGHYQVIWSGDDARGRQVSSGVYRLQATIGSSHFSHTVTLLK